MEFEAVPHLLTPRSEGPIGGPGLGSFFSGSRILITGAAGFIGSRLAEIVATLQPERLVLLDASEQGIFALNRAFDSEGRRVRTILGDILDRNLLDEICRQEGPAIVFHAAAFKHVPLLEKHPLAAIKNNILGTANLIDAVRLAGCNQFILVSTDKAVEPASIMGASKRVCELMVLDDHGGRMDMRAVRLGNVLSSPGSILPLFLRQIARVEPITVTHPEAKRYFLTADAAADAILHAAAMPVGVKLYIPHMGAPLRIVDLAQRLLDERAGASTDRSVLTFTQLKPGEKLEEKLLSSGEQETSGGDDRLRAVQSRRAPEGLLQSTLDLLTTAVRSRDLGEAITLIQRLVPDYRPSVVVLQALALLQAKEHA